MSWSKEHCRYVAFSPRVWEKPIGVGACERGYLATYMLFDLREHPNFVGLKKEAGKCLGEKLIVLKETWDVSLRIFL